MKKIFILTLALCWGSVLSQPALAQTTPTKANATAGKSSAKNTSKTDKKAQKPAADKVKTVAKTDKKTQKPAADKAKTVAKTDKKAQKPAADKAKTVAKTDKKAQKPAADKAKTVAKTDKKAQKPVVDKAKTVAKTDKKTQKPAADKAKTVAKVDKKAQKPAADKAKTVAKADKKVQKPAADKAKTVAKTDKKAQKLAATKAKAVAKAEKKIQPKATPLPATSKTRNSVIAQGKRLIGTPYLWGGTSPSGFDCSGLVHYVYQKHGFRLPRSSRDQFASLPATNNPQPGDLVFFRKNGVINHVGIYLGGGNMLHAPQTGAKVRIESIQKPNWQRRYAGARRVVNDSKVVAKAPKAPVKQKLVVKRAPDDLSKILPKNKTVRKTR